MRRAGAALLVFAGWITPGARAVQNQVAPVAVETQHPRLFLTATRLRLLKRERERDSERWRALSEWATGEARMPETAFAKALVYRVSGDAAIGRLALAVIPDGPVASAEGLRETAILFDWCQDLLTDPQRRDWAARIAEGMAALASDQGIPAASARALAAIALYDDYPSAPEAELNRLIHDWWEGRIAPALKAGRDVIPRDDALPLFEMLHAVRDATGLDLRESCPGYFVPLPIERLMSYYPAAYRDALGRSFRIGARRTAGAPDPRLAAASRAADLAIVAFDTDLPESQTLQGWLMHDPFAMQDAFGALYEFLWANPYQPGLSYYYLPLAYYDSAFGNLFVRSGWDDSATWFGYWDGMAQKYANGQASILAPAQGATERFDAAVVVFGPSLGGFSVKLEEKQRLFLVKLAPKGAYRVEIEGQKPFEAHADPGGILELKPAPGREVRISVR
jgi:hypothetical protein